MDCAIITFNKGDYSNMVPAVYLLDFENVNSLEFLDLTVLNDED